METKYIALAGGYLGVVGSTLQMKAESSGVCLFQLVILILLGFLAMFFLMGNITGV